MPLPKLLAALTHTIAELEICVMLAAVRGRAVNVQVKAEFVMVARSTVAEFRRLTHLQPLVEGVPLDSAPPAVGERIHHERGGGAGIAGRELRRRRALSRQNSSRSVPQRVYENTIFVYTSGASGGMA